MCVLAPYLLVWWCDHTNKYGASTHIQITYRHITGM